MPEEDFLETEPATKTLPSMPLILFGVILLLIGILGGLLWWGTQIINTAPEANPVPTATRPTPEENNEPESNNAEADVQIINTVSSSDQVEAIMADIESTDIETLDKELTTIDNELGL